jgi:hypothetical protein
VSLREVTVEDHHSDRMLAIAGERNALLREIAARMAAKEVQGERLIELEEERIDLMRQLLERELGDTPSTTAQVPLRAVGRTGVAKRRRA